jgi:hypothetical protein
LLAVEREGLFRLAVVVDAEECLPEARVADDTRGLRVRTAKRERKRESIEQPSFDWRAVELQEPDDAAHVEPSKSASTAARTSASWATVLE